MYFTEEHELFRKSLKDFLQIEVVPHIDKWEKDGVVERFIWKKMGDMGFFGINYPEEFGGLNSSSGAVDGFTYFTWGTNGMRDVNMLRPATEEYVKPEVGTLIMFPSWLRHSVNPFFGDGERRTFSANINIMKKVINDNEETN